MAFETLESLTECLRKLGVIRLFAKPLAENDNTKQQIYLGGSFDVLQQLSPSEIREEPGAKRPNFKAAVDFRWLGPAGQYEPAKGAQLILYPDFPEVRLSGVLRGCSLAPSDSMQPVPKEQRRYNNGPDGRVLFIGVTPEGVNYAWLAKQGSSLSQEVFSLAGSGHILKEGVFWKLQVTLSNPRLSLLTALAEIHRRGWHTSSLLNADNSLKYCGNSPMCPGYTLESLLGITPNGRSDPDYLGWELKTHTKSGKITLMTPEPDLGYYGEQGIVAFLKKYGAATKSGSLGFTGTYRINSAYKNGQTLKLSGYDETTGKITDVSGNICLEDRDGNVSAGWSFADLMQHWARKHNATAYVQYKRTEKDLNPVKFEYQPQVLLGEGTSFEMYLAAMTAGHVIYDPAPELYKTGKHRGRSQFRVPVGKLESLYKSFVREDLSLYK